jgi:predicted RNA binding protein YcfA (HicA-like mRNA interferase family)
MPLTSTSPAELRGQIRAEITRQSRGSGSRLASDDVPIAPLAVHVTGKELAQFAKTKGWFFHRRGGRASHVIYAHPATSQRITIPIHRGKDVPKGLLMVLLKKINNP